MAWDQAQENGRGVDMLLQPGSSAKRPWVGVDMRRARGGVVSVGEGQQSVGVVEVVLRSHANASGTAKLDRCRAAERGAVGVVRRQEGMAP